MNSKYLVLVPQKNERPFLKEHFILNFHDTYDINVLCMHSNSCKTEENQRNLTLKHRNKDVYSKIIVNNCVITTCAPDRT